MVTRQDMDAKVKSMIKLIEEDADSFARRAEMYYKKRPELMAEVFPNQIPFDDYEMDPCTPDMPMRTFLCTDDLQKDGSGFPSSHFHALMRNGNFMDKSHYATKRLGLKQFNDLFGPGRVKKVLNFYETEETITQDGDFSGSEVVGKFEKEIRTLKVMLAKLEAEKDAGLALHQHFLAKFSELESNVSRAQEDSKGLNQRGDKAEGEVQTLKEALRKLEAEKESSLDQYQQCLERIANLENVLFHAKEDAEVLRERAHKAENEVQVLKLKENLKNSEDELRLVRFASAQLNDEIASGKDLLSQKDVKLYAMENEKSELQKIVEDLNMEHDEATKYFGETQISTVLQTVLEGNVEELIEACKCLENEASSKDSFIEVIEERNSSLEGENRVLKAQLGAHVPAINSLNQHISSLENPTSLHPELQKTNDEDLKDTELEGHHHVEDDEELISDQNIQAELSELQLGCEINKTKVLERLNSNIQKLTNLQITVLDLKRKMQISEKGRKGKDNVDRDTLKEQLEEAEETIMKFFDHNGKLMKSVENGPFYVSDAKPGLDSEESGNVTKMRILDQAQRESEKIGRLQLKIQKIQFVLLKLDEERKKYSKAKARIVDAKRSVPLRDYIYDGAKTISQKKKSGCCACVQPPTCKT